MGESSHARAFVGRQRELSELTQALDVANAGRGRLILIGGEPGIGKSRLADELSELAAQRGFQVLWGRCWEAGGAPAYWPWVQSLRSSLRDHEPERLRREMGPDIAYLAQLLPEICELVPDLPAPPSLDPEAARFRLFDATTGFLRRAAELQPILLVLDDLHAGDVPSLLLLRFLAGELTEARVVVLGLYRDTELEADHPAAGVLSELRREQTTRSLLLGGLTEADVARFFEITTDANPQPGLVATIHRQSEGNALFMCEIVRLLAHEGRLGQLAESATLGLHLPPGVRQVIGRRIRHLSTECSRVLTLAAVLGREFDLAPLERLSGQTRQALLQILEEAESARVVTGIPGTLGRMRFAHALIRDAFYDELTSNARVRVHRLAGDAIEEICGDDRDAHLAELAHHFVEAASGGEVGTAVAYARAAAERAARMLAFEEAARLYRMALRALGLDQPADQALRCDLLLSLGDVQSRANDVAGSTTTFMEAAELARKLGSPERLATATLHYGGRFVWSRGACDPRVVPLLREGLAALSPADSDLRVRLLARLAGALRDQPSGEERGALSREAVEMARRIGERCTLGYALDGRFAAIWEPGNAQERLSIAEELIRVATDAGDKERAVQGHHYRSITLLELGDLPGARAALEAKAQLAEELRQPPQRWYVAAMQAFLALFEGDFAEAQVLIENAKRLHPASWHAEGTYRAQLFVVRREQGRLAELEPLIRRSVDEYAVFPVFRAMLALLYTELGRPGEARQVFETLASRDFADLPWDCEWLHGTTLLAEVACSLDDLGRAATLYRLIAPYARFNVVAPAEVSTGSAARSLGLLATALSRWSDAEKHFQHAISMNEAMGARPWAAHARYECARMLLKRNRPEDRDDAREHLTLALACCRELGMTVLSQRVALLLDEPEMRSDRENQSSMAGSPAADAQPRLQLHVFRREGEYWSVQYEGETFRLKDTKGLRYLARLLAAPARELHALDLVTAGQAGSGGEVERPFCAARSGDAGVLLDTRAKAEYRERLEELAEVLEEAGARGDFERASRAEEERELLLRELSRAVGLGGRDRRAGSAAERARVNVTRAIKPTLKKIADHSPALGKHLASTIRTGTFCAYMPDPRIPILWEL